MLRIYNTLSRKKELFKPLKDKEVRIFVCGPTVYDLSHIGHARTYIAFDAIVKHLRWRGYKVFYLQNITDIDDKIINRAKILGTDPLRLSKFEEKEYYQDIKYLKIDSVSKYARATDYIPQIIKQVKTLLEKGFAYEANGSIYFDITKFPEYGKLSHQKLSQLKKAVRIEPDKNKKNHFDFALWKKSKSGEPSWPSLWGVGRPGWHIEDTAISEKFFGFQYDIHGGARDLIFPHHESEIAQMETASGKKPFVRYWMHTGFLNVGGQKMAKSLGNFITIRYFLSKFSPEVLRFLVLSTHYRSPINYTEKAAKQAQSALERINEFIEKLLEVRSKKYKVKNKKTSNFKLQTSNFKKQFIAFMDDDFNTPKALSVIFNLVKKGNKLIDQQKLSKNSAKKIYDLLIEFDKIFGILPKLKVKSQKLKIPSEVKQLVDLRERYRKEKNWQKADEAREGIIKLGYWLEDTERGPKIKQLANS